MNKEIITYFESEKDIVSCIDELLTFDVEIKDVISPFPIEGLKKLNNTRRSNISFYTLFGAIIGFLISLIFQYWVGTVDYKLNVSGKAFFNIIYSLPITFEISILFAAIFAFISFLVFSKLPKWYSEYDDFDFFDKPVDDFFVLVIRINIDVEEKVLTILKKWKNIEVYSM